MRLFTIFVLSLIVAPAWGQQFVVRATNSDDMTLEWAGVMVPSPPAGYIPTAYDFVSYDERRHHVAFEMGGTAFQKTNLSEGEVAVVCLWSGINTHPGAYNRYTFFAAIPVGKRVKVDWYGPSGDLIAAWLSPEGVTLWTQGFWVQSFPTRREDWKSGWRGFIEVYDPAIPEPGSWVLLSAGLLQVILLRRKT